MNRLLRYESSESRCLSSSLKWSDLLFVILPADVVGGISSSAVVLTQCIWPSDIINNLRAEMTSHPKVRILRLQGKKEKEWQNSGDLLDGERRDICWQFLQQEIHVTNAKITKWTDFGRYLVSLSSVQYNQRFSVIKIRPHTDAKTDLHIERVKKHLDSYYKICKFFQTHISHNIFQTSMRQNMPNTFLRKKNNFLLKRNNSIQVLFKFWSTFLLKSFGAKIRLLPVHSVWKSPKMSHLNFCIFHQFLSY